MTMKTSPAGRAAITQREGNKLTAYRDSVNVLTIGVGHTSPAGPPKVEPGMKITAAESDAILSRDLATFGAAVANAVKVDLAQHEFDALVSLAFNIGGTAFARSTLVRKLNAGDRAGAANAFLAWNKAGGKVLAGLAKRRKAERAQFLDASAVAAPKPKALPGAAAPDKALVEKVQQLLRDRGYPEVGNADGLMGSRTRNAILAFEADNGLALSGKIDDALLAELIKAPQRDVSPERATATAKDLKDAPSIQQGQALSKGGIGAVVVGGIGAVVNGTVSADDLVGHISTARTVYAALGGAAPYLALAAGGVFVAIYGVRFVKEQVQAYREGRHV